MRSTILVLAVVLAIACPAVCRAEDVLLVDGTVFSGTVDKVEQTGVTVTMKPGGGGTATVKVPASRLDPAWFYGHLDAMAGKDAKAHVDLASWAVEHGLFSRARAQIRKAEEIDPAYVKDVRENRFPEVREGIATQVLASAEGDVKAGRFEAAEEKLELLLLRLPDTEAGGRARDVMTSLEQAMEARDAKAVEDARAKLAEADRKAADERAAKFAEFDRDLAKVRKIAVEGLNEDSDSKALALLESALAKVKPRLADLDRIEKAAGTDAADLKEVADRRTRIQRAMVKVHLHRADIHLFRGNEKDAMREIDAAKAIDAQNPDVALAAIRASVSDDDVPDRWRRGGAGGGRFSGGARGGGRGGRR
jgi:hypothetical protein